MATLPTLTIPGPIIQGDTYPGFSFTVEEDDVAINLLHAQIDIDLVSTNGGTLVFSTAPGVGEYPISITDAAAGQFQVDEIQSFDHPTGNYSGKLKIILGDNTEMSLAVVEMTIRKQ